MADTGDSPKPTNIATTDGATVGSVKAPTAGTNTTANQSSSDKKLVFNSAEIGTKTARKEDVFAEHKRKDAEKKAKNKVTRRKILIFGGLGLVLAIVIAIFVVQLVKNNSPVDGNDPKVIEENQKLLDNITEEAKSKITTVESDEAGEEEDDSAAVESYQSAINTAKGKNEANVARLALMQHYSDNGDNDDVVKTGNEISDPDEMDLASRYAYYDTMAQAYYELAEYDLAEYYEEKAANLSYEYAKFLFGEQGGE